MDINEPVSMAQNFANFIERLGSARQGNIELPGVDVETIKQITDSAKSQEKTEAVTKDAEDTEEQSVTAYSRNGKVTVGTNRIGGNINVSA